MGEPLAFSVVVPTRDRPSSLARCLAAVERQEASVPFEVVVVDDGSRDGEAVAGVVRRHARARCLRQEPAGSVAARNRGVREARAPVVLLLDDDCEPTPPWARLLLARITGGAAAAAGRCVTPSGARAYCHATQVILDYLTVRAADGHGSTTFAPTYNLACRRDVLLDLPFDAGYVNSGADRDWCLRLAARGHTVALVPEALVVHRQLLDLRRFWRKHRHYGAGSARYHARNGIRLERPGFYGGLLQEGFRRGPRVGLAVCLAQAATATGYAGVALRRPPAGGSSAEQGLAGRNVVQPESGADGGGDVRDVQTAGRRTRT